MKLSPLLFLCHSCNELFERAPHGCCPVCSSRNINPLTSYLQDPHERKAWLALIGAMQESRNKRLKALAEKTTQALPSHENMALYLTDREP